MRKPNKQAQRKQKLSKHIKYWLGLYPPPKKLKQLMKELKFLQFEVNIDRRRNFFSWLENKGLVHERFKPTELAIEKGYAHRYDAKKANWPVQGVEWTLEGVQALITDYYQS